MSRSRTRRHGPGLPSRPALAAGVLAVALAVVTWTLWPAAPVDRPASRFSIEAPSGSDFTLSISGRGGVSRWKSAAVYGGTRR